MYKWQIPIPHFLLLIPPKTNERDLDEKDEEKYTGNWNFKGQTWFITWLFRVACTEASEKQISVCLAYILNQGWASLAIQKSYLNSLKFKEKCTHNDISWQLQTGDQYISSVVPCWLSFHKQVNSCHYTAKYIMMDQTRAMHSY